MPSVDLSPEELAKLRFLAARHFRFAQLRCKALTTPLPEEPGESIESQKDLVDQLGSSVPDLLLWLVAQAERCPVPGGWRRLNGDLYIDEFSCQPPRTVHPMLGHFLRLATCVVAPKTSRQQVMRELSCFRKELKAESYALRQQYENPQACGLQEWYHKQSGWFTCTDPLKAHRYLMEVVNELESKLLPSLKDECPPSSRLPTMKVRYEIPEAVETETNEMKGPEVVQLHSDHPDLGCSVYDISQSRILKSPGKSSISSPESTLGADGRTELECQYEQNWSSLVSPSKISTQTPQTLPSGSDSDSTCLRSKHNANVDGAPAWVVSEESQKDFRPPSSWAPLGAESAVSSPSSADPEMTFRHEVRTKLNSRGKGL
eukprot:s161_g2.t1